MSGPLVVEVRVGAEAPAFGSCRVCGDESWIKDDDGPVHACCARVTDDDDCVPCLTARGMRKKKAWGGYRG